MKGDLSLPKRLLFWAVLAVILLGVLEIFSFTALKNIIPSRVRHRAAFQDTSDYVRAYEKAKRGRLQFAAKEKDRSLRMFHRALGWDYPPGVTYKDTHGVSYEHGAKGERRTCTAFDTTLVATYGDSFAYCSDVADCETWQTYLGQEIRSNVLNFGVAGYGTDQAFLKYKLNEARVSTPIVILCILPDDINRVVNIFRTFYAFNDPLALTKPRFVADRAEFRLIENPLTKREDISKLDDPDFITELGKVDYWYQQDVNRPRLGFPYTISLIEWRKPMLHRIIFNMGWARKGVTVPFYPGNLFEEPEPLRIMCGIVDLFVETARGRGATPVVLIMPHRELVKELLAHRVSRVENLLRHLKKRKYHYLDLIQSMADKNPTDADLRTWYLEHATPEGNRITADMIAEYLKKSGLLPDR